MKLIKRSNPTASYKLNRPFPVRVMFAQHPYSHKQASPARLMATLTRAEPMLQSSGQIRRLADMNLDQQG